MVIGCRCYIDDLGGGNELFVNESQYGTVKPVDRFLPSMEKVVWVLGVLVLIQDWAMMEYLHHGG
jgi:hypothetical protein